jgi:uncharacterized protein YdhG (YjbR/CyaY superfamily)
MADAPDSVEAYIASQAPDHRNALTEIRRRILEVAPTDSEAIRYGMPAYRFENGHPVYFACWKQHVSLHDIPTFHDPGLEAETAPFRSGKDTLKFPHRHPIPFDLISRAMRAIADRPSSAQPADA